ncbi:MAG TPA: Asp-tRNA(Asn)/Glu-tRNA(Gln) amidotransferase subunit GatC [Candidatus Paceibacterota bacterium]|nr:Asp-tRNA(Asn)/Glu-tRNA(Gln) amidotransferase subunit GatC [Candidatus Paceibacterota bacterium]
MISKEEIDGLAELARLTLAEEERANLQKDISNILEYVGQVSGVPAAEAGAVPQNHNVMRADAPRTEGDTLLGKEEALRAAFPKREGAYNVVRKIIQKDE